MSGLAGFVIGFLCSAPFAAPYIAVGFSHGNMARGMGKFLLIVLSAAVVCAAVGLKAGASIGARWERRHRQHRRVQPESREDEARAPVPAGPPVTSPTRARDWSIRYDGARVDARAFAMLAQRVWPRDYAEERIAEALERTVNIGAWDGEQLVGSVRVLTDGYLFATVPEILVDPDYRRRGIGRELMQRALRVSPRRTLFLGAQIESTRFFESLGAVRGPVGFTLKATE
ncbi:MAG: GNAT family N-acetyltransferase [Gemmatimonadaceae bacterium]